MDILGISAFYHDSAAALLRDRKIIAAAQEERFTRRKHDPSFPLHAARFYLEYGARAPAELDAVAIRGYFYQSSLYVVLTSVAVFYRFFTGTWPTAFSVIVGRVLC